MARSPLTLAATVTSALPRVGVIGVASLTEGGAGRYDSAVAELDDHRRVVVRVPATPESMAELADETRALRALSAGVRALLPFRAADILGEGVVDGARFAVVDFLPGYRVDGAHLPPGRGAATSIGEALAALHALPISIVRTEGLPVRTPAQVREDARRVVERVAAVDASPIPLLQRWRRALDADELWRFESAVVLGGANAATFLIEDIDEIPTVTGALDWHGLSVGDPAVDLQWLASAPGAADDVFAAYTAGSDRAPDGRLRERARLYAELEFGKWLVHGDETGRADIVEDAATLLATLSDSTLGDDIVSAAALGVDDAIALLDRVPDAAAGVVDTSMQTDAYDPDELSLWSGDEADTSEVEPVSSEPAPLFTAPEDQATAPIDLSEFRQELPRTPQTVAAEALYGDQDAARSDTRAERAADDIDVDHDEAARADAERASDAALRRWLSP